MQLCVQEDKNRNRVLLQCSQDVFLICAARGKSLNPDCWSVQDVSLWTLALSSHLAESGCLEFIRSVVAAVGIVSEQWKSRLWLSHANDYTWVSVFFKHIPDCSCLWLPDGWMSYQFLSEHHDKRIIQKISWPSNEVSVGTCILLYYEVSMAVFSNNNKFMRYTFSINEFI